jgi:hypothetical protein
MLDAVAWGKAVAELFELARYLAMLQLATLARWSHWEWMAS